MKFLVDENIHADVVAWLRSLGQDVLYAAEALSGNSDEELLNAARRENRIIVTDDKDFGELVFHRRILSSGVILLRLTDRSIQGRLQRLGSVWATISARAEGSFMVISDKRVRLRPLAPPTSR
jgi:predicted nuclease of predicted toxin-antitoxin system